MALTKLSNREVRPQIIAVMGNMPAQDRNLPKKVAIAIKSAGYKPPSVPTIRKAMDAFASTNGMVNQKLGLKKDDDSISMHDLAELLSQKDLITRVGIEKIKKIAEKW